MLKVNKTQITTILSIVCLFMLITIAGCSNNQINDGDSQTQQNNSAEYDNTEKNNNSINNEVQKTDDAQEKEVKAQEDVIKKYYKYTSDCDMEGMLSVCDANSNNILNSTYSLLQFLLNSSGKNNVNVRKFFMSLIPSMKSYLGNSDVNFSIYPTSINISPIDATHSTATVLVDTDTIVQGQSIKNTARHELELVKEGKDWKVNTEEACQQAVATGIDLGTGIWGF